jgi:Ni/Fe-hydrogenase subunit HybB-like protein
MIENFIDKVLEYTPNWFLWLVLLGIISYVIWMYINGISNMEVVG